jgi:hypothetical protein
MTDATDNTMRFVKDLGDAARRNPVSAALIGMGVLWLFTGGKSVGRAGDLLHTGLDRLPEAASDALDSAKAGLGSGAGAIRHAARSAFATTGEQDIAAFDHASDPLQLVPEVRDVLDTARDNLTELFRAQPLALGAIGLAIGAGIAAALPRTDLENAYLGEVSETVKNATTEIAGQQVEKATAVAADVFDATAAEARKQGLTPDGARAAFEDVTGRVSRVVDVAKKSVAEQAG